MFHLILLGHNPSPKEVKQSKNSEVTEGMLPTRSLSLMFSSLSYPAQDHLPKDGLDLLQLSLTDMAKHLPGLVIFSTEAPTSQVTLGCIKMTIKTNQCSSLQNGWDYRPAPVGPADTG